MGKISKIELNGGKLAESMQMDRRFMFMKNFVPRGLAAPAPGLNTFIWSSYLNIFFSETAQPIKAKLYVDRG